MRASVHAKAPSAPPPAAQAGESRRPGFVRRLFDAIKRAHQRRVERELAIRLGLSGGRFTDEIERRLSDHVTGLGKFRR